MNDLANIASITMAAIAVLGLIGAVIVWFYKRGGHETAIVTALNANTESNHEVTKELRDFKAETLATLKDHHWRLSILEDKTRTYEDNNAS